MAATAIAAVIMADAAAMATVEECTRSAAVSMVAAVEVSTVVVVAFTVAAAADTGKLVRLFAPDLCDGPCRVTPGRFAFARHLYAAIALTMEAFVYRTAGSWLPEL